MRIGEIAALAGVTPRTVRHYHHLGLVPEPGRLSNGYRDYRLAHAIALVRVRRMTELGLGLAEVRDVLADDEGRELVEVLEELDADLARQQKVLEEQRARLRELVDRAAQGLLPAEGPVSPELGRILTALGTTESPMASKDRTHMALIDGMLAPADRERIFAAPRPWTEDTELQERIAALYERLDALADADVDDPRIGPLGLELAACVPDELLSSMNPEGADLAQMDDTFGHAFLADFAPAQAAAVRAMLAQLTGRGTAR
ncbi:MerR family transcriptional regulator [Streptomyces sp. NPDC005963]|uniref:MerR family transcriptional regulator n=1 Tax=Streptomyces sp. NPDC005963 TaxID=3156721 RepID=UPI0033C65709